MSNHMNLSKHMKCQSTRGTRLALIFSTLIAKDYVIAVDYFSNFFEVGELRSTNTSAVIKFLSSRFARHGIPSELVSDNCPQFTSSEFKRFAMEWSLRHVKSVPYHPQSNGKVENSVKTAKALLQKSKASGENFYLLLLAWRNTPSEGLGVSPVHHLMSRRTCT